MARTSSFNEFELKAEADKMSAKGKVTSDDVWKESVAKEGYKKGKGSLNEKVDCRDLPIPLRIEGYSDDSEYISRSLKRKIWLTSA